MIKFVRHSLLQEPMLALILSFLFAPLLQLNQSPWPYQHVSKKDGLSNSAITSIYMDQNDYVWLGTWDGLNRYDGTNIKVYKPDSFKKGTISNNIIRNILEDKEGNLWIVTHMGLNKYDRDKDSFQNYLTNFDDLPFLEYNTKATLGPDSTLWVNTIGRGISKYDSDSDQFATVKIEGVEEDWLKNIAGLGSSEQIIYMLGNDGKLVSAINNRTFYAKQLVEPEKLQDHEFFRVDNQYFLALSIGYGKVYLYNLANIEHSPQEINLKGPPSTISENKSKTALWIGTESGSIFKLRLINDNFDVVDMAMHFPQFSKDQRKILSITETRQDLLWVGTDGDGVFKFLTKPSPFLPISSGAIESGHISNSIVRSVYEGADGTLYIGTRGGGLNIVSPEKKATQVLNTSDGLHNNAILSLNKDLQGNLWVGTDGTGIDMVENKTNRIFHFPDDFINKPDLNFGNVYAICIDAYGTLWLGTSGYGVIQLQVSKSRDGSYRLDSFRQITNVSDPENTSVSINSNVVYSIVEEMPNILWFGTRGAGVYRYNTLINKIEEFFNTKSEENNRLSNDDVLSLYIGTNDLLWIGTSGGLNRLSLQRRSAKNIHYTQYDGLSNNTIHGILEDNKGMIWLSTNSGLILFDPLKSTFKTFDKNDGLQNDEFTDGASFKSTISENLFFGGIKGLDIINPNKVDTISSFPRLAVSEFQVHNMVIIPNDSSNILSRHIDKTESISLKYNQNFISFQFTTLNYWNKQHTEYGYFLENFDKEWNYINNQNVVKLTNIPPGDYRLLINYKKDGIWNPNPRSISITVQPPLWLTTKAYVFYGFLLLTIQIFIILSIRRRVQKKRAAAIEILKVQQMKELNDYKFQFFTNIAHEFRTPLTLIFGPVTTLMKKSSSVWEKRHLKTIYNNSLRLQKLIEELLHFRKIESGKDQLMITKTDLVSFTQEIVETFTEHALEHEVNLEYVPEEDSIPAWVDVGKLEKILINLISNAIKYNTKGGNVEVVLLEKEEKAHFIIKDTGIGISATVQDKVFEAFYHSPDTENNENHGQKSIGIGLSLTKSLVRAHQGDLHLESKSGQGSVFTVVIPIKEEAYQHCLFAKNLLLPSTNLAEKVLQEFSQSISGLTHHDVIPMKPSGGQKRVYNLLIVDDNDQIIILLKSLLSEQYHIFSASNGKKGLLILDEEKIDLVICDVLMPDMDGLTLCRNIKDNIQTSHIPVILLTAKAEIEDRIEGLQMGADSYIPKPFHPEHLFIRIEKLINNRENIRNRFSKLTGVDFAEISTGMGEKDDEFFIKITQCIQKHLTNPEFTADIIAEEVGMSKASLYKKVKAITSLTPHGLIKQYRLRKAADLLQNSNMNVSEVIYETGFNSRSYFYKSFNEMFHCHPKDFDGTKVG